MPPRDLNGIDSISEIDDIKVQAPEKTIGRTSTPPPAPENSQLPNDLSPATLSTRKHPKSEEVVKQVIDFFLQSWKFKNEENKKSFVNQSQPWFIALSCPLSLDERLHWGCQLMTFDFLVDDVLDSMSVEEGLEYTSRIMECASGKRLPDRNVPAEWIAYDLFEEMRAADKQLADELLDDTLEILTIQADPKRLARMNLHEYFAFREVDMGKNFISGIMRFCMGLHMTVEELELVKSLESNASKHTSLVNDICSFEKEIVSAEAGFDLGTMCSSLPIFMDLLGVGAPEAKRIIWQAIRAWEVRHSELVDEVLRQDPSPTMKAFCKGLDGAFAFTRTKVMSMDLTSISEDGPIIYNFSHADFEIDPPQKSTLENGRITLSEALDREDDMRLELRYVEQTRQFFQIIYDHCQEIQEIVASHCGLSPERVHVPEISTPEGVYLPYKVGEAFSPNNVDEKARSEAATHIWINDNCPDIPIPTLRGFGLPCGLSFFKPRYVPLWPRIKTYISRFFLSFFKKKLFAEYIPLQRSTFLRRGYTLIDWVASDEINLFPIALCISHTESQFRALYRSMSRIILSLAKIPQSRIGSWTIDDGGCIRLSNRPTLRHLFQLENLSISCGIPRNTTYKTTDGLHLDILASHDQRLRSQDNAATNEADARAQAKDLVLMRALLDKFTDSNLRNGPFVMQMTDLCLTNIFLDRDWNVKYIIDLEGVCSLPIEHLQPPQWLLTMKAVVDAVQDKYLEEFKERFESFAKIFEEEEKNTTSTQTFCSQADIIKRSLKTGGFWYWHALQNPWAMFNIFRKHILPLYDAVPNDMLREAVSPFWEPRMRSFVYQKTEQYARYCEEVQKIFKDGREIY
ncbi:hypothetical protein LOZ12_000132 [Ophidiomyces ophidiicola]|uniref:Uncharacterized protein n=1 Tax=Ophidiomyces ophidiicola TaxID=1387563 RepID=A0ACB8V5R1_9EURO|nr:uncharacterized protein LOZ57_003083 [Ophidiomyces ophidiicola]KAI1923673.1 hypothetical protein LOZ64_000932 [Ophidiomyces ophidiicola]KAI1947931.1 hypothetical protein LOZ57_003083 [Ophidiomyces ophidiicola]KAI1956075.1 hypothetical protein LOZ62_000067 [Ophidiomyces ophidiicola]KAI1967758.1 hypothetical protein LOZ59_000573 [Ophidiomyces ophidiicola]KAI1975209.1 hypothetical protein LOZ56_000733 [Ophidiomyces ophidiicola]